MSFNSIFDQETQEMDENMQLEAKGELKEKSGSDDDDDDKYYGMTQDDIQAEFKKTMNANGGPISEKVQLRKWLFAGQLETTFVYQVFDGLVSTPFLKRKRMELQKNKDHAIKDLNLKVKRLEMLSLKLTDLVVDVSKEMANVMDIRSEEEETEVALFKRGKQ